MIILKSIGNFFVKIWRWIKETAWVQPLLIVGAIFAVVFSIPYISEWASDWSGNGVNAFYNQYVVTLEGEGNDLTSNSEADRLTKSITKNTLEDVEEFDLSYGEKFFLVYTKDGCSNCTAAETGFRYLRDNWGKYGLNPSDDRSFKMYTINGSEKSSTDDDYDTVTGGSTAFNRYLTIHTDLFQSVGQRLEDRPYKSRAGIDDANYRNFALDSESDSNPISSFPAPSIVLVDYSAEAVEAGIAGVSEILFSVTGETDTEKARLLMNMWNHLDEPSASNLFTVNPAN